MSKKKSELVRVSAPKSAAHNVIAGKLIRRGVTTPIYPALIKVYDNNDRSTGALRRAEVNRTATFTVTIDKQLKEVPQEIVLYTFDGEHTKVLMREPIIVHLGSEAALEIIIEVELLPDVIKGLHKGLGLKMPGPGLDARSASRAMESGFQRPASL